MDDTVSLLSSDLNQLTYTDVGIIHNSTRYLLLCSLSKYALSVPIPDFKRHLRRHLGPLWLLIHQLSTVVDARFMNKPLNR